MDAARLSKGICGARLLAAASIWDEEEYGRCRYRVSASYHSHDPPSRPRISHARLLVMIFETTSAGRSLRRANSSPDLSSDMVAFDRHAALRRIHTSITHSADAESLSMTRGTRSKRARPNDVWLFDRMLAPNPTASCI